MKSRHFQNILEAEAGKLELLDKMQEANEVSASVFGHHVRKCAERLLVELENAAERIEETEGETDG